MSSLEERFGHKKYDTSEESFKADENITYSNIANVLARDYFSIYYIDAVTDHYIEYSSDPVYQELKVEQGGEDFFSDCRRNIMRIVHPADVDRVIQAFEKETLLKELDGSNSASCTYRLMFNNTSVYVSAVMSYLQAENGGHFVIGVRNIDNEMKAQQEYELQKEKGLTYSRIAQALSKDYFSIYYVNAKTDKYIEFSSDPRYRELKVEQSGSDFFEDSRKNILRVVHEEDRYMVFKLFEKENMLKELEKSDIFSINYRLLFDGVPVHVNVVITHLTEEGGHHLVIGIRNIDAQVKRDAEHAKELGNAKALANKDSLTGVKSKHAYVDDEQRLDEQIDSGEAPEFAVVVCDVNGLKAINDNLGHKAGDEYIREASSLICTIFKHSPVYRIGGDEFAVILKDRDYENRDELIARMESIVKANKENGGVVIAAGIASYDPETDTDVAKIFERADAEMYSNKKALKGLK